MSTLIATRGRRVGWAALAFLLAAGAVIWLMRQDSAATQQLTDEQLMTRLLGLPALLSVGVLALLSAAAAPAKAATAAGAAAPAVAPPAKPFVAQVVGLQWLNPLQRRDYSTEWQLLWTLGLARPNKKDHYANTEPENFGKLKVVGEVAAGNDGKETFKGYHHKYVDKLTTIFHDIYFSAQKYFYTVAPDEKKWWRELAGIHVEYALPAGRLDPIEAAKFTRDNIADTFNIGNPNFPSLWTRDTPPDVRVTMGGTNAGFTSLSAALDYLQAHPKESVWVMSWDAPSFPGKDPQLNENLVLLVLTGPDFKTEREPLAWVGYPATKAVADYKAEKGQPPRIVQAWKAAIDAAARNAGKVDTDIGYVVHDADNTGPHASERIGALAQTLTTELPEFDFIEQTFNTPALLGDMGAGTALTNAALAIAYANHLGKNVLVAGTTDAEHPTAMVVVPPAKVRPIDPEKEWFRARGEGSAYLPWWGLRHDAPAYPQGYSQ